MKLKETLRAIIREEITKVLKEENSLNEAISEASVKATFNDVSNELKSKGYSWSNRYLNRTDRGQRLWMKLDMVRIGDARMSERQVTALLDKTLPEGYNFQVAPATSQIHIYGPHMQTGEPIWLAGTASYLRRRNGQYPGKEK